VQHVLLLGDGHEYRFQDTEVEQERTDSQTVRHISDSRNLLSRARGRISVAHRAGAVAGAVGERPLRPHRCCVRHGEVRAVSRLAARRRAFCSTKNSFLDYFVPFPGRRKDKRSRLHGRCPISWTNLPGRARQAGGFRVLRDGAFLLQVSAATPAMPSRAFESSFGIRRRQEAT
jgi:hypothetical protein